MSTMRLFGFHVVVRVSADEPGMPLLKSRLGKSMGATNGVGWRVMVPEVAAAPLASVVFVVSLGKAADGCRWELGDDKISGCIGLFGLTNEVVCACICFDEIFGRRLPIRIQDQYTHVDATEQAPERLSVDVESSNGQKYIVFLKPGRVTLLAVPVVVTGSLFAKTL